MEAKKAQEQQNEEQIIMKWSKNQVGLETKANEGIKATTHTYKPKNHDNKAKTSVETKAHSNSSNSTSGKSLHKC